MSVTQKQIAERLNISRSLVARALQGHSRVAESTRALVQEVAMEMGYDVRANRDARALIARRYGQSVRSALIAITFPSALGTFFHYMPFFIPVLAGVEAEAKARGLQICLCPIYDHELPHLIREHSVDGVLSIAEPIHYWPDLAGSHMPVVTLDARAERASSVSPDDRRGAYLATRHLLDLGHRRIGYLAVGNVSPFVYHASGERLRGYTDAMKDYGAPIDDAWIVTLPSPLSTATAFCSGCGICAGCIGWSTLMEKNGGYRPGRPLPLTGVVCHNDPVAMGVSLESRRAGVRIPEEMSVVGFDDVTLDYRFEPPITSIRFSREEMGREMVRMLEKMVSERGQISKPEHRVFPVELVVRASAAKPFAPENEF